MKRWASEREFVVNDYITLKLEDDQTNIYIDGDLFIQCKLVKYNYEGLFAPPNDYEELVNWCTCYPSTKYLNCDQTHIPPEVEFWAHSSNLQVWIENDYNLNILNDHLAFSLLKRLSDLGDDKAKGIISQEIVRLFKLSAYNVMHFLLEEDYIKYLTDTQINELLKLTNYDLQLDRMKEKYLYFLKELSSYEPIRVKKILNNEIRKRFNEENKDLIIFITREGIIDCLNEEAKIELLLEYFKGYNNDVKDKLLVFGYFGYLEYEIQRDLIKDVFPNNIYPVPREVISSFYNILIELSKLINEVKSQSELSYFKGLIDKFLKLFENNNLEGFLNHNPKIVKNFVSPIIDNILKSSEATKEYILGRTVRRPKGEKENSPKLYFIEDFLIKIQIEKSDIKTFNEIMDSQEGIDSQLIKPLILLFENEELFEFREYNYGRNVYEFKDKEFQNKIVVILIKEFLKSKTLRGVFLNEISAKSNKLEELADLRLFEIFLDNISPEEFKNYFRDFLELFGDIFLNLMEKYNRLKLDSYWTSSFWFDFNGIYKKIGEQLSQFIKQRILDTITKNNHDDLLFLLEERLFHALNKEDAIEIFNNSKFDFIEYILNLSKIHEIDPDEEVNNLIWYFPLKLDAYISKYIKKSLIKIINKNTHEDVEGIIRLSLHDYIDNKVLNSLSKEGGILYFKTFSAFYDLYNPVMIDEYFNDKTREEEILRIIKNMKNKKSKY